ncbi:hypothetical protein LOTGIDRAFT_230221 [Lottia gigantea]|uniref:AP-5 complex subunit zeta-1 n=1 Tax=Lottia gigantea TaxID=225164 RepID=V4CNF9_LOTGI|nr:hypothetical protein LOTGIDRAFT_230221 [Lottia gigantea]ESP03920.1 hypothetical protein LOTGIDRAFT_230221 [Lottia gigantea]
MSIQAVDNLFQQARKASDEDIEKLCNNILDVFHQPEKLTECTNLLRQLYFILQVSDHPMSLPKKLLENLITSVGLMNERNLKQCLICQRIVKEVMPLDAENMSELLQPESGSSVTKNLFPLYIAQGKRYGCIKSVLSSAMRWLGNQDLDFESQRQSFVFLVAVSILHTSSLNTEYIETTSSKISQWLLNASIQQAPNPYTINPFRKDQTNIVNEIDGTPSQNFFTFLNIGQYYTEDQFLNIHSFSMLYKWLYHCHKQLTSDTTVTNNGSDMSPTDRCKQVFGNLASKTVEYCFRLLDQCERKPKVATDAEIQIACLYETVTILDLICSIEANYIPKVHQEIKRLYTRLSHDVTAFPVIIQILQFFINHNITVLYQSQYYSSLSITVSIYNVTAFPVIIQILQFFINHNITVLYQSQYYSSLSITVSIYNVTAFPVIIQLLQFFINHSSAVVHDPQETYQHVFTEILSQHYTDQGLMFDIVNFIMDNLDTLCYKTSILSTYFPNIFKILAWHPRTFLAEFIDILPALMSPTTSLEIFHTILDLPCMTGALETIVKSPENTSQLSTVTVTPASSLEAYQMALYRPLLTFITRVEGGHGDTINRLDSLHGVLDDLKNNPRVTVASQTVPVLLRVWFEEILENGGNDFAIQLLPVMLERSILLYPKPDFTADVKRILSENLVKLLKKYKSIVISQYDEISDFLISTRNIYNREEFYTNLVWCVGEYCTVQHSKTCTADLIAKYYNILEAVTYETSGIIINNDETSYITLKTVSVLISALSKLATRCQDLIPRAILCLTKVTKQHLTNSNGGEILVSRCQELINILKLPNFASVILNPPEEIESGRWHKDNTSIPILLRASHRHLTSDG